MFTLISHIIISYGILKKYLLSKIAKFIAIFRQFLEGEKIAKALRKSPKW